MPASVGNLQQGHSINGSPQSAHGDNTDSQTAQNRHPTGSDSHGIGSNDSTHCGHDRTDLNLREPTAAALDIEVMEKTAARSHLTVCESDQSVRALTVTEKDDGPGDDG